MQGEARRILATLAQLAAEGADAGRIADQAIATWREVDAILSPVIGKRGVAALFKRSLHLTGAYHPWFATVRDDALHPDKLAAFQTALSQQTSANAAAANGALLQTFWDLLTHLIGGPLTERLLRSVWHDLSSSHTVQDDSP